MQDGVAPFVISGTQGFLVIVTLLCCVGCLWMVFFFGRQIQTSAYVRRSLVDAVRAQEIDNLIRELDALRDKGPLDPNHPPPPGFEREAAFLWRDDRASANPSRETFYNLSEEDRARRLAQIEEDRQREREERAPFVQWCQDERERYAMRRGQAEQQAMANAESRVPKTMDIALLGGGWAFLLEFSTVIVILFILLCLGILNAITGRDSITILASIAGYVLGKASANAQRGHASDGHAATPAPIARPANGENDPPAAGRHDRSTAGRGPA